MKHAISLVIGLYLSAPLALADTEFGDAVPVEFVRALLGVTPYGDPRIYSDILDDFPEFTIPDGFEVLGSADQGYSLTVVLATDLDEAGARAAIASSFADLGYTEFNPPGSFDPGTGFIAPSQPLPVPRDRYCHDQEGFITISFSSGDNQNTLSVRNSAHGNPQTCAQQLQEQTFAMSRSSFRGGGLREHLPRMELPQIQRRGLNPFSGMGSSSNGSGVETRASINIDWEIEEVYEHFKSQIEEQGWELDAENVGSSSATGTWTRSPDPDMDLIGTLSVIMSNEEQFDLTFNLVQRGGSRQGFIGGSILRGQ